jgi:hypothetical protein
MTRESFEPSTVQDTRLQPGDLLALVNAFFDELDRLEGLDPVARDENAASSHAPAQPRPHALPPSPAETRRESEASSNPQPPL